MTCPHCESPATTKRQGQTSLGSRRFRCRSCGRRFNERSGTPLNDLQYATDVVLLAVLRRLRYKLSFRDIAEMRLERGFSVTPETIREWEVPLRAAASLSGSARSVGAAPAVSWYHGRDLRAGRRAAGALSTAPSTARAISWTPGAASTATSTPRGASCGDSWTWPSASRSASRPMPHPPYRRAIRGILGRNGAAPMQSDT